jgi:hypothetical protein
MLEKLTLRANCPPGPAIGEADIQSTFQLRRTPIAVVLCDFDRSMVGTHALVSFFALLCLT